MSERRWHYSTLGWPAANAVRCRFPWTTKVRHAGRDHSPHRRRPGLRARRRNRLVHAVVWATPDVRPGEEVLWDIDEHATLFIEPDAARAGAGRISFAVSGLDALHTW